jgi:RNA-directed DNA polymerase
MRAQAWYGQANERKCGRKGDGASEHPVVLVKPGNLLGGDPVEGRGCRSMEPLRGNTMSALKLAGVSTKQQRIAVLAQQAKEMAFTSLAYHIDIEWLQEAYRRTRKDGASGVDGQTAEDYAANLEANLQSLLDRAKSGTYFAPPVRRVHIPKGTGTETRPIGIPTFEDKVLQRAVVMVLESVYEQDFLPCSYGFRPGRSPHQALEAFRSQMMKMKGGWVVEVDIRKFFDTLDHRHLRNLLDRRIRDGVLRKLIDKWLKAGVMEAGELSYAASGSPQGGVISPMLSNIYLHYVLDVWFEQEVLPRMQGRAFLVRFADDFVMGFEREDDARRVLEVLPKRFEKYGLTLHPTKTRLVRFTRPPRQDPPAGGEGGNEPGSFDLLGFTHYWGRSRQGNWVIRQTTAKSRLNRAIKAIRQWCRQHRHQAIREQHRSLKLKLQGHYAYYGVSCNLAAVARVYRAAVLAWKKWLGRRSQKAYLPWTKLGAVLKAYPLPPPRIVHRTHRPVANP